MTREEAISMLEQIGRHECVWMVCRHNEVYKAIDMAIEALKDKRPHGEWLKKNIEFGGICWATCSVCKKISNGEGQDNGFGHDYFYPNFCPNCGADMRKEGDKNAIKNGT